MSDHVVALDSRRDNARVNRGAATRIEVCLAESDIMGGTTIRRLIGHKDFTASVQRFVIQLLFGESVRLFGSIPS